MMAHTRVTVLVENTARGLSVLGEHGLSYWIEHNGRRILLDSGQGGAIAGNAYKLGIPLHDLDSLILSHGHYDHTGGAAEALKGSRSATVYAHPAAFAKKYTRNADGTSREIGMPYASEKAIRDVRHSWIATTQPTVVVEAEEDAGASPEQRPEGGREGAKTTPSWRGGLVATGPVPRMSGFEDTGGAFFLDEAACTRPDPLEDDQSVFFDTSRGIVVLLGCAHSGVINTLRYIRQLTDNRPIHAVIGGMHLVGASSHRIERTIEELERIGVERLAPAHCTGMPATVALWNAFPGRCQPCPVGMRFDFD